MGRKFALLRHLAVIASTFLRTGVSGLWIKTPSLGSFHFQKNTADDWEIRSHNCSALFGLESDKDVSTFCRGLWLNMTWFMA